MATLTESFTDVDTPRGLMRVHLFEPAGEAKHPGIIFYSEIFQATSPIRRMAAALAGNGYVVAVPEVYHEFEELGTVLGYDNEGSARGNELKYTKEISSYDDDNAACAEFLLDHPRCNGNIAGFGVCLGGHLALRSVFHPAVRAAAAFYPTDVHTATLGRGKSDDTLQRLKSEKKPLFLVFGRQDPHVPLEGRRLIRQTLEDADADFEWHEFNAAHAFLRDEGPRYNPALARNALALLLRFLAENGS